MTIDVKSATAITFLVKVNGGIAGAPEAAAEVTHNGDGTWQTLSFTFNTALDGKAATTNGVYSKFVIHAYWKAGETAFEPNVTTPARTFYVDNLKGPAAAPVVVPEPTNAPATPPNYSSVISLYGDAYGTAVGLNGVTWDNGSEAVEGTYASNNALKITNGSGDFIGFNIGNTAGFVNATTMTHVHADFCIAADMLQVKC